MKYENSPDEFFVQYLIGMKFFSQTKPMAVGTAFDYYVKDYISREMNGLAYAKPDIEHDVWDDGMIVFKNYKVSGALASLMSEIKGTPVLEDTIERTIDGVPILGKPDLLFDDVVIDWKVNGFYSSASPVSGYDNLFEVMPKAGGARLSRRASIAGSWMERKKDWALQLSTYALLTDRKEVGIDQISHRDGLFRTTTYRGKAMPVIDRYKRLWEVLQLSDDRLRDHFNT
jgi:hypothetical protein